MLTRHYIMICDMSHSMIGPAMTITAALPTGTNSLLLRVRGNFAHRGTSLAKWCRENNVDRAHAHRVLCGITNGRRALELRQTIVEASQQY